MKLIGDTLLILPELHTDNYYKETFMTEHTAKPNQLNSGLVWLTRMLLFLKNFNYCWIITCLLFNANSLFSRCPCRDFFNSEIKAIYNAKPANHEKQLQKLTALQEKMKDCQLEKDSSFMYLLQKKGVLYFKLGNYTKAIEATNLSVQIAKDCINRRGYSTLSLVNNFYNLYFFYSESGQQTKKYETIDSCVAYTLKGNCGYDMAIELLKIKADYLFDKGDYSLCKKDAALGSAIIQYYHQKKDSLDYVVSFVNMQANTLYFSDSTATAIKLLESKKLQFTQSGNSKYTGTFNNALGMLYINTKNYSKALSCFQQAYVTNKQIHFGPGCCQNLMNTGKLYAKYFNRYNDGLTFCSAALKYAAASDDSLIIFKTTANIYVQKKMFDTAFALFQQAFNTQQPRLNETTVLQRSFTFPGFNMLQELTDLITDKGDALVQQYYFTKNRAYLKNAIAVYKKADLFLAKIKTEQQLQFESNLVWRRTAHSLYEHAVEACYANNDLNNAFYFFEKSRAILLNDQINQQRWMADADIARQAQLKKNIHNLETSLNNHAATSREYMDIQKNIYTTGKELEDIFRSIKIKTPLFYQDYLDSSFISLQGVKDNILQKSKSLVEIFSGDSAVYVFTVSASKQSLIKISKQLYDSLSTNFTNLISNAALINKNFASFVATAQSLYHLLFPQGAPAYGSIIISPDIKTFPFEALVTNSDATNPDYFNNHYAVSYTYSAKYLINQFAKPESNTSLMGIAPVEFNRYPGVANLTGSDASLLRIKKNFTNAALYTFADATKNNFLQHFTSYSILQLYTHAAGSSDKNNPVIYFSDSAMYLSELLPAHKPITQLVVLSACQTANGNLYQGEGIFSFNRGFASLGIPAAISNLWDADNESTYFITELLYKYLQQGLPTDVALQKARLDYIRTCGSKQKTLPYYWASGILIGKVASMESNKKDSKLFIRVGIILLFSLAIILFPLRKNLLKLNGRK